MPKYQSEMRLFDDKGERLYVSLEEREAFIKAAEKEPPEKRVFCHVLHFTGCRPTEALELAAERVLLDEKSLVFRSLKKRKRDGKGNLKAPVYRTVPVPEELIRNIDLVFDIRRKMSDKRDKRRPLWKMSRTTAWDTVKRVMANADIHGKMATSKGLRHGYAMALGMNKVPATAIRDALGHTDTKTTEIYTRAVGEEMRELLSRAWK